MERSNLKEILLASQRDLTDSSGLVQVSIELREAEASEDCIHRLCDEGLLLGHVAGNKVSGAIDESCIATLRHDPAVVEVEITTPRRPR